MDAKTEIEVRDGNITAAETFNRETKLQNGNNIVTVSLEWNEKEFGYIVFIHDTQDGDKAKMTQPQGFIQAHDEYRKHCIMAMEIVFGIKIIGSESLYTPETE